MARDIEEFLRRAAERRQKQKQQSQTPSQRVREIVEATQAEVVEPIEIVEAYPVAPPVRKDLRHQSVSEHVRSHIDTDDVTEHADHLGERIMDADDRMADRLRRKFSHDVSKLDDRPTVQDDPVAKATRDEVPPLAQEFADLLRSPDSIRNAILMTEILNRPKFDR